MNGVCRSNENWLCPGWEECAGAHDECSKTQCCADSHNYACYKRPHAYYAQCRIKHDDCTDSDDWLCPGWELCSAPLQECTHTHCCSNVGDTCYARSATYAACLPAGTCSDKWPEGLCTPYQSERGECVDHFQDCSRSGCCNDPDDHCYKKSDLYSQCRQWCPTEGWECTRHEIPSESLKITCRDLSHGGSHWEVGTCSEAKALSARTT